jgi:ubiquinone/menaquinone biosynthesis C-methylase UbiE
MTNYVHGYTEREAQRLREQALILEELLHGEIDYPAQSKVLEPGCGVGAQTAILARRNPEAEIVSIDKSEVYLSQAEEFIRSRGIANVVFEKADLLKLPFAEGEFDHVFVCFVLEHTDDPQQALSEIKRVLKPEGTVVLNEGDHGSCFWYPQTGEALKTWNSMIKVQQDLGHDPLIGRKLYPLMQKAGFKVKQVLPRWIYADAGNPELMQGVINQIIVPMTSTARTEAVKSGLIEEKTWDDGLKHLEESCLSPEGTFFYTWFRGIGVK